MYDRLGQKMQFGFRPNIVQRLDAEVRDVTPSLRKRPTIDERARTREPVERRTDIVEGRRLYLVLFTLRTNPSVQFIKVGISRLDLLARFQRDAVNYEFEIITEGERARDADAKTAEAAFHAAFLIHRQKPVVRLASGNTECYRYTDELLRKMREVITGL